MLKKLFPALVIVSFLSILIVPTVTLAADLSQCTMKTAVTNANGINCPAVGSACPYDSPTLTCGICCVLNTIYNITNWIFVILIAIVAIMVLLGAFQFLTSAGSPEGTKKGREYIIYAAIGLMVAFLARAVPAVVTLIVGA